MVIQKESKYIIQKRFMKDETWWDNIWTGKTASWSIWVKMGKDYTDILEVCEKQADLDRNKHKEKYKVEYRIIKE